VAGTNCVRDRSFGTGTAIAWQNTQMTIAILLIHLVVLPATAAFLFERSLWQRSFFKPTFAVGTRLIYRQQEVSTRPAPNACDVHPAERGDFYYYSIINHLRVIEVLGDGRVVAITRNKARLCFWPNDSSFRKARMSERLIHRSRFPRS